MEDRTHKKATWEIKSRNKSHFNFYYRFDMQINQMFAKAKQASVITVAFLLQLFGKTALSPKYGMGKNVQVCVGLSCINVEQASLQNCWFSHHVTKIQTKKLSILPRFYFHDALEQLKTNFHTNFSFKRVLGFVIEYAWISKLMRDAAFTWRPRELSCRLKKWLISGNFAI